MRTKQLTKREGRRKMQHFGGAPMKQIVLSIAFLFVLVRPAAAQKPEPKFIADTLVVEAEGT